MLASRLRLPQVIMPSVVYTREVSWFFALKILGFGILKKSNHREEMNTTLAHASGSERCVCFDSVFFRVNPW